MTGPVAGGFNGPPSFLGWTCAVRRLANRKASHALDLNWGSASRTPHVKPPLETTHTNARLISFQFAPSGSAPCSSGSTARPQCRAAGGGGELRLVPRLRSPVAAHLRTSYNSNMPKHRTNQHPHGSAIASDGPRASPSPGGDAHSRPSVPPATQASIERFIHGTRLRNGQPALLSQRKTTTQHNPNTP